MPLAKNLFSRATKMAHTEATAFLAQEKVLVYHYRGFNNGGTPIVKGGVGVMLRSELEEILRTNPTLRATAKALSARARSVDIYARDVLLPPAAPSTTTAPTEVKAAISYGTENSNVAGVTLPVRVWLEGLVRGKGKGFKEIVIVSKTRADAMLEAMPRM